MLVMMLTRRADGYVVREDTVNQGAAGPVYPDN